MILAWASPFKKHNTNDQRLDIQQNAINSTKCDTLFKFAYDLTLGWPWNALGLTLRYYAGIV